MKSHNRKSLEDEIIVKKKSLQNLMHKTLLGIGKRAQVYLDEIDKASEYLGLGLNVQRVSKDELKIQMASSPCCECKVDGVYIKLVEIYNSHYEKRWLIYMPSISVIYPRS